MAAVKRFGNLGNAVKAGRINYEKTLIHRCTTESDIKCENMLLYRSSVDLFYSNMRKNYQYLLAAGMKKLGNGSWAIVR